MDYWMIYNKPSLTQRFYTINRKDRILQTELCERESPECICFQDNSFSTLAILPYVLHAIRIPSMDVLTGLDIVYQSLAANGFQWPTTVLQQTSPP